MNTGYAPMSGSSAAAGGSAQKSSNKGQGGLEGTVGRSVHPTESLTA